MGVCMCGGFDNHVGVSVICVLVFLYCLYCVFVLFRLCIFILICFVCTSIRTAATEWQLNCSSSSNNNIIIIIVDRNVVLHSMMVCVSRKTCVQIWLGFKLRNFSTVNVARKAPIWAPKWLHSKLVISKLYNLGTQASFRRGSFNTAKIQDLPFIVTLSTVASSSRKPTSSATTWHLQCSGQGGADKGTCCSTKAWATCPYLVVSQLQQR